MACVCGVEHLCQDVKSSFAFLKGHFLLLKPLMAHSILCIMFSGRQMALQSSKRDRILPCRAWFLALPAVILWNYGLDPLLRCNEIMTVTGRREIEEGL